MSKESPPNPSSAEINSQLSELIARLSSGVLIGGRFITAVGEVTRSNNVTSVLCGDDHGGIYRIVLDEKNNTAELQTVQPPSFDDNI